jgi:hypothetical protein
MAKTKRKKPKKTKDLFGRLGVRGFIGRPDNWQIDRELDKLAKIANKEFKLVGVYYKKFLDHAILCGEILIRVKALLKMMKRSQKKTVTRYRDGEYGKYPPGIKRWIDHNFDGSYSTASVYMRLAHNKDKLKKAQAEGIQIASIQAALRYIGEEKPKTGKKKPRTKKQQIKYAEIKDGLIYLLRDWALELLDDWELALLFDGFEDYFWPRWYEDVRETVCLVYGYSPYPDIRKELKKTKRKARRKVRRKSRVTKKLKKT